jgi:hypothetical protein
MRASQRGEVVTATRWDGGVLDIVFGDRDWRDQVELLRWLLAVLYEVGEDLNAERALFRGKLLNRRSSGRGR